MKLEYDFDQQEYPQSTRKWIDRFTGYPCMLRSTVLGHLCGYVRVPHDHPWYRRYYTGLVERRIDVHGGVTFAGTPLRLNGGGLRGHWFGFDCAHLNDFVPALDLVPKKRPFQPVYRDADYVAAECVRMAYQLWSVANKNRPE